jgi:hypothetical protein
LGQDSLQEASDQLSVKSTLICKDIKSGDWESAKQNTRDLESKLAGIMPVVAGGS